ncbi:MAG: copper-binding protein [Holophagales bacterium]|nr:copper-binding protein [Holophagales bacterium]
MRSRPSLRTRNPLPRRSHPARLRPGLLLAAGAALLLANGCEREPEVEPDRYTTRGIVRQLPETSRPGSELFIHHEEIPEFRDMDGENTGMGSMMMPFPVAEPALLDGLEVGDRVSFTFEVRWQGSPPIRVTGIEPLPDDTRLGFETETTGSEGAGEEGTAGEADGGHDHTQHDHSEHGKAENEHEGHGIQPAPGDP